jgi:hypothetical protein
MPEPTPGFFPIASVYTFPAAGNQAIGWFWFGLIGGETGYSLAFYLVTVDGEAISNRSILSSEFIGTGEWFLVMATYDLEVPALKLFIDDVEDTGATCNACGSFGETSVDDPILVGKTESEDPNANYYFSGDLFNLRIYNTILP